MILSFSYCLIAAAGRPGKEKQMNKTPKTALFHDLSGYGRCSLGVAIPVLSAMGAQCCAVPTAYLSAHTAYPPSDRSVFHDMTEQMAATGDHWQELGASFDAVYSGFLGSARQIGILEEFVRRFRTENTLVLIDPVMGDYGAPYRTYTPEMCREMAALAALADVITPNLTEVSLLLGEPYEERPKEATLRRWLEALSLDGRRSVAVTGVHVQGGKVGAVCLDRATGAVSCAAAEEVDAHFPGTGDLYASVLLGGLLRGEKLAEANRRAVSFVQQCAADTLAQGSDPLDGVRFEPLLGQLMII